MFVSETTLRRFLVVAAAVHICAPAPLFSQTAAEHIALGDKDHAALNPTGALRHYEEAIKADGRSYDALWKATREAVDIGEYTADEKERIRLYTAAEQYARRAVEANPADADAHFILSRALGRRALSLGKKDQVKYGGEVRTAALAALKINPRHDGALHVMGMWNYHVMRLNRLARIVAKAFFGGKLLDSANWDDAQRYLEDAAAIAPSRVVHHLDLARVHHARDNRDRARASYKTALELSPTDFNDARYQAEARQELAELH